MNRIWYEIDGWCKYFKDDCYMPPDYIVIENGSAIFLCQKHAEKINIPPLTEEDQ